MIDGNFRHADRAIIYRSELDFVSRCILDRPNIEKYGENLTRAAEALDVSRNTVRKYL